jgi:formylglycine-generating enzyme required for sulfatase activity
VVTVSLAARRAAPLSAAEECSLKPKDTFLECENCPEMVVVPAGSFTMGSPEGEGSSNEGPQHVVKIAKPFAVGKFHVTVDQFAAFVAETRYKASSKCVIKWKETWEAKGSWRNHDFTQERSHPVVCVSWDDAKAYVDWLAKKIRKPYRLLSEAEFEYAARGRTSPGTYPRFWFGNEEKDLCRYGNGDTKSLSICNDGYDYTSPVGHYEPNAFGLYDMAGNAWQWTEDCYHMNYSGAPADGSAWTTATCGAHVFRGGSWHEYPVFLRAAYRLAPSGSLVANTFIGFRLARTLTP